jgi:hypothetical protein
MGNKVPNILITGALGAVCALVSVAAVFASIGYQEGLGALPNAPRGVSGAVAGAAWSLMFSPIATVLGFVGGVLAGLTIEGIKSAASNRRQ